MRCCNRDRDMDNCASVPHHQHRAFGVAHHMAGIGAEEIGPHRRPMRGHHDQVGLDRRGFLKDLVIDAALPHSAGDARSIDARFARDDRERLLGGLALLVSKSAGTYSASITGVIGSTFRRRTVPLQVCDSVAAVAIAGLARSVSARSIGTRMDLNICASLLRLQPSIN